MGTKDDPKRDFVNKFFNNNMRQNTLAATLTDSSKKNMTPTKNTGELNQVKQNHAPEYQNDNLLKGLQEKTK